MQFLKSWIKKLKKTFSNNKSVYAGIALVISFYFLGKASKAQSIPKVKLSYFLLALSQNIISEVLVEGKTLLFRSTNSNNYYQTDASMLSKDRLFLLLKEKPEIVFSSVEKNKGINIANLLITLASAYLTFKIASKYIMPEKEIKPIDDEMRVKVKFDQIYGLNHAKSQLQEIIDFLKHPSKYQAVGARLRKGVLIYGPPGTGKTMLAKATAGESNANFIFTTASEFVEMYVGVGAKRVRDLFSKARKFAPCIIFIDEIDGVGSRRKNKESEQQGAEMERATTLNQLLTEMDGFQQMENIVVIAATNRLQLIDDALLRSGRFDTKIKVNLPDEEERKGILQVHLRNKKQKVSDETLQDIASKSEGLSGADLENVTNESAYNCIHKERDMINDEDILEAFDKIYKEKQSQFQYF
ncbi:ATP-dependent metalloprotease FtsH (macronuclear) [Tetrahymena thermophila SB210]|uniref:ATP-dependent metalloprotease FtsH n=1 Tax=Tetrahymena thermophila (strain SB210) TaxID=312017 RepID=Q24CC5_TETTS|nr:ATP-dependent metalloprotease FtsH [Tetrahymena thermophila SB210]EAS05449.2 ATP-dependent metalloprotease FtsH [Tetrahymena thermophila SB210]|eukprot:XP_001025694.2 ATP-dependent metalloprotease FtsH [Tetrahymena thermophila SB210]